MALASSVTGTGKLISRQLVTRQWVIHRATGYTGTYTDGGITITTTRYLLKETYTEEVREWVALTQAAAVDYADANAQPSAGEGAYTYDVYEQNRIVGAYGVRRVYKSEPVVTESVIDE